jgi:hypothetical protein
MVAASVMSINRNHSASILWVVNKYRAHGMNVNGYVGTTGCSKRKDERKAGIMGCTSQGYEGI